MISLFPSFRTLPFPSSSSFADRLTLLRSSLIRYLPTYLPLLPIMGEPNRGSPSKQLLAFSPLAVGSARNEGPPPLAGVESRRRRVQL